MLIYVVTHITPKALDGCSYFLRVVDDHSRYMWVEMLKTKDQALEYFKKIKLRAELESDGKLKALRTDRGENLHQICSQFSVMRVESNTTLLHLTLPSRME
jgi:hypothetical protein